MAVKSQVRQICDAKEAFLVTLNKHTKSQTTRYAVYLHNGERMTILWPYVEIEEKRALLPFQVYWKRDDYFYPCYHFAVSGCGFNHADEIKRVLQRINPAIKVRGLNGWQPSII